MDEHTGYQLQVHLPGVATAADAEVQTGPTVVHVRVPNMYELKVRLSRVVLGGPQSSHSTHTRHASVGCTPSPLPLAEATPALANYVTSAPGSMGW
jgi:hypothetical protein